MRKKLKNPQRFLFLRKPTTHQTQKGHFPSPSSNTPNPMILSPIEFCPCRFNKARRKTYLPWETLTPHHSPFLQHTSFSKKFQLPLFIQNQKSSSGTSPSKEIPFPGAELLGRALHRDFPGRSRNGGVPRTLAGTNTGLPAGRSWTPSPKRLFFCLETLETQKWQEKALWKTASL